MQRSVSEILDKNERVGSIKNALKEEAPELAQMLAEMTPTERSHGRLIGALLSSSGRQNVDEIFDKHAENMGCEISAHEKILCLTETLQHIGDDQKTYNALRKMMSLVKNESGGARFEELDGLQINEKKLFKEILSANSNVEIETAFQDYGNLTYRQKMMILFRVIELFIIEKQNAYIEARNYFVKINLADK